MPVYSRALASLLHSVCVRGLAPSLKCGQGGRTFVGPDIVTMQRVAPHRRICRVMANVETQSREHLFLAGDRECMLGHPPAEGTHDFLGIPRAARETESAVRLCQLLGNEPRG